MLATIRRRIERLEAEFDRLWPHPGPEDEPEDEFANMSDEEFDAVLKERATFALEYLEDPALRAELQAAIDEVDEMQRVRETWRPEYRAFVDRTSREARKAESLEVRKAAARSQRPSQK